jgi:hypothetical protein
MALQGAPEVGAWQCRGWFSGRDGTSKGSANVHDTDPTGVVVVLVTSHRLYGSKRSRDLGHFARFSKRQQVVASHTDPANDATAPKGEGLRLKRNGAEAPGPKAILTRPS